MKLPIYIKTAALIMVTALTMPSCKKEYDDLNNPTIQKYTNNATQSQLNNLVAGTESGTRNSYDLYLDVVSVIGREIYRFADPRFTTELLGADGNTLLNSNFYITLNWSARYRVIKNTNVLIEAANKSTLITEAQRKGYTGFAKTVKAYQLLLNLNLTYTNGIRVNVTDPNNLGPVISYDRSLTAITALLDSAKNDLQVSAIVFQLSPGFKNYNDAGGLIKFNRALAARVAVYQRSWNAALTALNESFFDINGDLYTGINHVYSTGSGDQLNAAFTPQNQNGDVRLAHPSFTKDIEPEDDRINKATLRKTIASLNGLSSNRDAWVYTSSTASIPLIRNEELILLYAEAKIQSGAITDGLVALNKIRRAHNIIDYAVTSAKDKEPLINELLKQRRYSLFFEGHRWIDLRRYNKLNELPLDRPNDDVWEKLPLPVSEIDPQQ